MVKSCGAGCPVGRPLKVTVSGSPSGSVTSTHSVGLAETPVEPVAGDSFAGGSGAWSVVQVTDRAGRFATAAAPDASTPRPPAPPARSTQPGFVPPADQAAKLAVTETEWGPVALELPLR